MAALRARGVDWLAPSDAAGRALDDETLIARLAAHPDARLRAALTGYFLLNPQGWQAAGRVCQTLDAASQIELMARYMAAVYLQRCWRTRLSLYQGKAAELPDLYSAALGLPPAEAGFGRPGLYALAEWHSAQSAIRYNRLAEYNQVIEHIFAKLEAQVGARESAFAS